MTWCDFLFLFFTGMTTLSLIESYENFAVGKFSTLKGTHYPLSEKDFQTKKSHDLLFSGFKIKGLADPLMSEGEKDENMARTLNSVEKIDPNMLRKLRNSEQVVPMRERRDYILESSCNGYGFMKPDVGIVNDVCLKCDHVETGVTAGCKVSYDDDLNLINFTSYESLSCNDDHWHLNKNITSFRPNECYYNQVMFKTVWQSNDYAHTTEGYVMAFYNATDSTCGAPFLYQHAKDAVDYCFEDFEGGTSYKILDCGIYIGYNDMNCSNPINYYPLGSNICVWEEHGDYYGLPDGVFRDTLGDIAIESGGYHRSIFMNRDTPKCITSPCRNMVDFPFSTLVGVPSKTTKYCKDGDEHVNFKVDHAVFALDSSNASSVPIGMAEIRVTLPPDTTPDDKFRIVFKQFDSTKHHKKLVIFSHKFTSSDFDGNHTITFQWEIPYYAIYDNYDEMTIKFKERKLDLETGRFYKRKSCVRFRFPPEEEYGDSGDVIYPAGPPPELDWNYSPTTLYEGHNQAVGTPLQRFVTESGWTGTYRLNITLQMPPSMDNIGAWDGLLGHECGDHPYPYFYKNRGFLMEQQNGPHPTRGNVPYGNIPLDCFYPGDVLEHIVSITHWMKPDDGRMHCFDISLAHVPSDLCKTSYCYPYTYLATPEYAGSGYGPHDEAFAGVVKKVTFEHHWNDYVPDCGVYMEYNTCDMDSTFSYAVPEYKCKWDNQQQSCYRQLTEICGLQQRWDFQFILEVSQYFMPTSTVAVDQFQ